MAPRSIWRGTISFGLVSVPVRMHTATESKELKFHFLHKDDLAPIGYDKVRKDTGEHVDPDDVVRGFEIEKGRYVPLEDEDLDRLDIELTRSIDICDFVDLDEIDPIYSGRPTTCSRRAAPRSRTCCSSARSRRRARLRSQRS
jgi:DNA end-binding protein Ku